MEEAECTACGIAFANHGRWGSQGTGVPFDPPSCPRCGARAIHLSPPVGAVSPESVAGSLMPVLPAIGYTVVGLLSALLTLGFGVQLVVDLFTGESPAPVGMDPIASGAILVCGIMAMLGGIGWSLFGFRHLFTSSRRAARAATACRCAVGLAILGLFALVPDDADNPDPIGRLVTLLVSLAILGGPLYAWVQHRAGKPRPA